MQSADRKSAKNILFRKKKPFLSFSLFHIFLASASASVAIFVAENKK